METTLEIRAGEKFAEGLQFLSITAGLNREAVCACLDAFDHSDPEQAHYAPQSVAFAYRGLVELKRLLVIAAGDLEDARAVREAMVDEVAETAAAG